MTSASVTKFRITIIYFIAAFKNAKIFGHSTLNTYFPEADIAHQCLFLFVISHKLEISVVAVNV